MKKNYKIVMIEYKGSSPDDIDKYVDYISLCKSRHQGLNNKLSIMRGRYNTELINPQHLYILSDEEIKKGDWVVAPHNGTKLVTTIKEITKTGFAVHGIVIGFDAGCQLTSCKKIIASTDKTLSLPGIPQPYIEYYIEEYNKDNVIEEIELEIDTNLELCDGISKIKLQNNEVVPTYNTSIIFGDNTSLNNIDKEYSELILDKMANQFIQITSYAEAMKMADREGYVHYIDFGKIHIDNWTKTYSKKEVEDLLLKATSRTWNTRQDVRDWFNKNN